MYNAVGADIIRPREADSLPYGLNRWVGALFNEAEETTEPSPCPAKLTEGLSEGVT